MWPKLFLILSLTVLEGELLRFEGNGFIYYLDIYSFLPLQVSQIRKYKWLYGWPKLVLDCPNNLISTIDSTLFFSEFQDSAIHFFIPLDKTYLAICFHSLNYKPCSAGSF